MFKLVKIGKVVGSIAVGHKPAAFSARKVASCALPCLALGLLATSGAHAGTGGTEFSSLWTTVTDWAEGTLGKLLALAMFLTGVGMGVMRSSIAAAVPAVAGSLAVYSAPTVIGNIVTATLAAGGSSAITVAMASGFMG